MSPQSDKRSSRQAVRNEKLLITVARGLASQPAYLLLFAIVFIMGGSGVGVLVYALASGDASGKAIGAALFVVALIATYFIIHRVEPFPARSGTGEGHAGRVDSLALPSRLREILSQIATNIAGTATVPNTVFQELVREQSETFALRTSEWAQRAITVYENAGEVLTKIYSSAQRNVFATSVPEYLAVWSTDLGKAVLEAHESAGVRTERVFVFRDRRELSPEVLELLRKHDSLRSVYVYVFFHDEAPQELFPPAISKDFAIIDDGAIVGITNVFKHGDTIATWYFGESATAVQLTAVKKELLRYSTPLSKLPPLSS